jgi:hypothetical protein
MIYNLWTNKLYGVKRGSVGHGTEAAEEIVRKGRIDSN